MKKNLICLTILLLVMCTTSCLAFAETLLPPAQFTPTAIVLETAASDISSYPKEPSQTARRTVTIYQEQPDHTFSEGVSWTYDIATVTYRYIVDYGLSSHLLVGGSVNVENYPIVTPAANAPAVLNVRASHTQDYSSYGVTITNQGYGYTVRIVGGYSTITYRNKLWYAQDGVTLLDYEETTVTLGYYYEDSETLDEVLRN